LPWDTLKCKWQGHSVTHRLFSLPCMHSFIHWPLGMYVLSTPHVRCGFYPPGQMGWSSCWQRGWGGKGKWGGGGMGFFLSKLPPNICFLIMCFFFFLACCCHKSPSVVFSDAKGWKNVSKLCKPEGYTELQSGVGNCSGGALVGKGHDCNSTILNCFCCLQVVWFRRKMSNNSGWISWWSF
jgi:hypothetical protein